jgi:hypothetical protein
MFVGCGKMRLDMKLKINMIKVLSKGIRCSKYITAAKMIRSTRSRALASELAEDLDKDLGPVYLVNYGNAKIIVFPDHVHVIGAETEEEARSVVEKFLSEVQQ